MPEVEDLEQTAAGHDIEDEEEAEQRQRQQAQLDQREAMRLLADNFASCLAALLFSLTLGLALPSLSAVLAATGQSDRPHKALLRYLSTARRVVAWHLADPADPSSPAGCSTLAVRRAHTTASCASHCFSIQ